MIVFGADIQGAAVRDLVQFGSRLPGKTRYMALGDYANSRGAADMGVLPDRLPGYAPISDATERARFGKLWGGEIPPAPGLNARANDGAAAGRETEGAVRRGRKSGEDVWRHCARPHLPASNCSSCRICS